VLPDEIKSLEVFSKHNIPIVRSKDMVRIITYTSHAMSPRLLGIQHIEYLAKAIGRHTTRKSNSL